MTLNRNTAKKYPLNSFKMLGAILKECRGIVSDYRSIISEETSNDKEIIKFFDKQNQDFYFTSALKMIDKFQDYLLPK